MTGYKTSKTLDLEIDSFEDETYVLIFKQEEKFEFLLHAEKIVNSLMSKLIAEISMNKFER